MPSRLYDVTIYETAEYSTVIEAMSRRGAEKIAEEKFLGSIMVATMFCTNVPEREVVATPRKGRK